jgi:Flp pilus assembly protein TadD
VWRSNRSLFLATAESHPQGSWTHVALGRIYAGNGGHSRAAGEFRIALALFDQRPDVWSEAIHAAVIARELALADSLVTQGRRAVGSDYFVSVAHAYAALEQRRFRESLQAAREALALAPDSAEARLFEGFALIGLGFPDSARRSLSAIRPGHPLRAKADSVVMQLRGFPRQ